MAGYVLADLALDDLADIRHYIGVHNPPAAERVIAGLFRRFEMIGSQPEIGEG